MNTKIKRTAISRIDNSISFIYIEHAIVEQDGFSVCIIRGNSTIAIPIGTISCIMLGPGTSITHRAVQAIADTDCLIVWCGERGRSFYASGRHGETSSQNTLRQAQYWADKNKHLEVVKKMYNIRFPEMPTENMSLERMRGAEGKRVNNLYKKYSEKYGVEWNGRNYDRNNWDNQDLINKYLSIGNDVLYNVCHAVILALGFSPEIGFIHTGKMRSFVWDIADLYKHEIVIPNAFETVAIDGDDALLRRIIKEAIWNDRYMKKMVEDLMLLFDLHKGERVTISIMPELWAGANNILGGKNHGVNV